MTATFATNTADIASVHDLTDLVRSLNSVATELQSTHASLQAQVVQLKQELAEANAQLRRSQALAALGEMAAGIAHEVRNPLGSIQLNVQMLAQELGERPAQAELCSKVSQAVEGIDAIVRDVLSFAREMRLRPEPIGAGELFDRALDACESLIHRAAVHVQRHAVESEDAIVIEGDALLLTQAIGNVVRNAVEAMVEANSDQRTLRLSVLRQPRRGPGSARIEHVVLRIEDSGPGIPPGIEDRIFNPFFTTRSTGTGLGLAMVHRVVEAHGGHIALGKATCGGACVDLCLPERMNQSQSGEPPMVETATAHRPRRKRTARGVEAA